jgi:hypothetical protein
MKRSIELLLLVFTASAAQGQNIYSALQLNEEKEYKTKKPKMIVETNAFYGSGAQRTEKCVKVFDGAGMLVTEERFDESGNRTARFTHKNDTVNLLCMSTVFERWDGTAYSKETTVYSYDASHFLVGVTDQDANGRTMRVSKIVNNEKGDPVSLSLSDGQGGSFGTELGTYFYDLNKVVTTVFDSEGKQLSIDTSRISHKDVKLHPEEGYVYNEHGDAVKWTSKRSDGTADVYEAEYLYDEFGNCIDEAIFKTEPGPAGKQKKKKDRKFKRQYTY